MWNALSATAAVRGDETHGMILCCPLYGKSVELVFESENGQNVRCPFCDEKFLCFSLCSTSNTTSRLLRMGSGNGKATLRDKAQQEEAEEAAYYERLRQNRAERLASAQAADEQRWQKKVGGVLSNVVLSYGICKAKVKD